MKLSKVVFFLAAAANIRFRSHGLVSLFEQVMALRQI